MGLRSKMVLLACSGALSARAQSCNSTASQCAGTCTARIQELAGCFCDTDHQRCACSAAGAALRVQGQCELPVPAPNISACSTAEMQVRALVASGAIASPELSPEHIAAGQASPAAATIFRHAAARAMGLGDDVRKVTFLNLRLAPPPQAVQREMSSGGPMVLDIHLEFCAAGVRQLPHGADFERAFAIATQEFAAFLPSSTRVLELEDLSPAALGPSSAPTTPRPLDWPVPPRDAHDGHPHDQHADDSVFAWLPGDILIWLTAALVVVGLGLTMAIWQLLKNRRRMKQEQGARSDAEADVQGVYAVDATAGARAGHIVSAVLVGFDPSTEDSRIFAAAAGLSPEECLRVTPGDIVEVIASGEGWLYGRLLSSELFGYMPEECVQRVPHTPPASPTIMEAGLAASVAAAAAA